MTRSFKDCKDIKQKRPRSGYIIFSVENRQKIIKENPGIEKKQKEIIRLIAEKWKNLSDSEKKIYLDKALLEKRNLTSK